MKNIAILSFLLSLFLVSCGDDSGSSADDLNEESELSSSSSSKVNKSSKSSSSSSKKAKVSSSSNFKSSSSSSEKANNNSKTSSSSSDNADIATKDIQNWKDTTEGVIRKGNITDIIYIFNNKKWRIATLPEASLGGCNEKTVGNFGYAEERIEQDLVEPRVTECIERTHSSECGNATYYPGYYICYKNGQNKFYWERLDANYYGRICNDSSYYAKSKDGDVHWGSIEPVKKKCINCKQENFDYLEDICKKRCYVRDGANQSDLGWRLISGWRIGDASECALGFGGCIESRFGTIKEGPVIKTETQYDYLENEKYISYSYVRSIDSTQKRTYICWYTHSEIPQKWYNAADLDNNFYYDIYPAECTYDHEGQIISGKKNKYVCDDENLRIATQEEIEEGIACTEYNMYVLEKCGSELEKQTGMTCAEYMRLAEKCRTKQKE